MSTDQIMQLVYLGLLGTAIAGAFFVANRDNLGKTLQQGAIWVLIFIGVIGAYGLWEDISRDVTNRQAIITDSQIAVPRSANGHYHLTLNINDQPVRFIVDTGASQVVLSQADAQRVGIDPASLQFFGTASTANGLVRTAPVTLGRVALGPIIDTQVPAVVNGGQMDASLLGMDYLGRFGRIEIANDQLVLSR
ncbi:retropepsin-like aspartic protease family protein [Yoonia sp.]|uniref:retropepsin-like aspartic protease family protein n=1 Tax=Yoonia sp. TaxID=2212373 RepID=UPI003F6D6324